MTAGLLLTTTFALGLLPTPPTVTPVPLSSVTPDSVWTHQGVVVRRFDGVDRRLEWQFVVSAPREAVWAAWVEPQEMITWASPGAFVDLRIGGSWEAHFEPERPPGERGSDANSITSFIPGVELRLRAGAPPEFPTIRAEKTDFTVRLTAVTPDHTNVLVTQSGWGLGDEWDRGFEYLARANAEWLSWMVRRYVSGPLDWSGRPGS